MSRKTIYIAVGILVLLLVLYLMFQNEIKAAIGKSDDSNGGSLSPSDKFPLKRGSYGPRVGKLQEFLNSSGGYGLDIDDDFGGLTEGAVKSELGSGIKTISAEYYESFIA